MTGSYTVISAATVSNIQPHYPGRFINPPEVAILGVGRTTERAVPDEDSVVFRTEMTLDLSFDHRVVDGADAARFLETLSENLTATEQYVE